MTQTNEAALHAPKSMPEHPHARGGAVLRLLGAQGLIFLAAFAFLVAFSPLSSNALGAAHILAKVKALLGQQTSSTPVPAAPEKEIAPSFATSRVEVLALPLYLLATVSEKPSMTSTGASEQSTNKIAIVIILLAAHALCAFGVARFFSLCRRSLPVAESLLVTAALIATPYSVFAKTLLPCSLAAALLIGSLGSLFANHPLRAGLFLAAAVLCDHCLIYLVPLFAIELWRRGNLLSLARMLLPVALAGASFLLMPSNGALDIPSPIPRDSLPKCLLELAKGVSTLFPFLLLSVGGLLLLVKNSPHEAVFAGGSALLTALLGATAGRASPLILWTDVVYLTPFLLLLALPLVSRLARTCLGQVAVDLLLIWGALQVLPALMANADSFVASRKLGPSLSPLRDVLFLQAESLFLEKSPLLFVLAVSASLWLVALARRQSIENEQSLPKPMLVVKRFLWAQAAYVLAVVLFLSVRAC